jgi:hypothetical protein
MARAASLFRRPGAPMADIDYWATQGEPSESSSEYRRPSDGANFTNATCTSRLSGVSGRTGESKDAARKPATNKDTKCSIIMV